MNKLNYLSILVLVVALLASCSKTESPTILGEEQLTFRDDNCEGEVKLCSSQEVHDVVSNGKGKFEYELNDDGTLDYELSAKNLNSNVTQAHIHMGVCGQNGGVLAFLFGPFFPDGVPANGNLIEGTLTDADLLGPLAGMTIADLCDVIDAGNAYINLHTVSDPAGELRGQLGDENCDCDDDNDDDNDDDDDELECDGEADLCGSQEVHEVNTNGQGKFEYHLNANGTLDFELSAEDLNSNVTQAHIHLAGCGQNGGVVAFLFGFVSGGVPVDGEFAEGTLTDADLLGPLAGMTIADLCAEINAGNAYINVHTVSDPAGELRGQLGDPNCDCDDNDDDDSDDDDDEEEEEDDDDDNDN